MSEESDTRERVEKDVPDDLELVESEADEVKGGDTAVKAIPYELHNAWPSKVSGGGLQ